MIRRSSYISEVKKKCESFKSAGFWPSEPTIRTTAWLDNFTSEDDKFYACRLLDNFVFFNKDLSNKLLSASFSALPDVLRNSGCTTRFVDLLKNCVFTAVNGEDPNVTDSGYHVCRNARQILNISDGMFLPPEHAIAKALDGATIIFCDDFIGSGDQFIESWQREHNVLGHGFLSFADAFNSKAFQPMYLGLVSTKAGIENINKVAPNVCVSVCHVIDKSRTLYSVGRDANEQSELEEFLTQNAQHLNPSEHYMSKSNAYKAFGYKNHGLLLGFEHSIPDATLPIFWSPGTSTEWQTLVRRL